MRLFKILQGSVYGERHDKSWFALTVVVKARTLILEGAPGAGPNLLSFSGYLRRGIPN